MCCALFAGPVHPSFREEGGVETPGGDFAEEYSMKSDSIRQVRRQEQRARQESQARKDPLVESGSASDDAKPVSPTST